jgi:hypothetical protein
MIVVFGLATALWLGAAQTDVWAVSLAIAALCVGWGLRFGGLPRGIDAAIGSFAGALGQAGRSIAGCFKLARMSVSLAPRPRSTLLRYRTASAGAESAARLVALVGLSPERLVLRGDEADGLLIHASDEASLSDGDMRRLEVAIAPGEALS